MPTNTVSNPARVIISINSGSSARFTEASVLKDMPFFPLRHSISAGSTSSFRRFLLPIKLSSTKKTPPRQPRLYRVSNSAVTWAAVLVRKRCPSMAVTLQKSHPNGHPREYCRHMEA